MFSLMSELINGESEEVALIRDGTNKLIITTKNQLTDEQVLDLFIITFLLSKTGKRLKDLYDEK